MKTFVIQKYIESPFLINKRKFDIRVWVCLNQDMDLFFFREGYLRLSSADYSNENLLDDYVHLTNNAIQKNSPLYGKQEDGNQLSFVDLRNFFRKESMNLNRNIDFDRDILPKMKYQTYIAL